MSANNKEIARRRDTDRRYGMRSKMPKDPVRVVEDDFGEEGCEIIFTNGQIPAGVRVFDNAHSFIRTLRNTTTHVDPKPRRVTSNGTEIVTGISVPTLFVAEWKMGLHFRAIGRRMIGVECRAEPKHTVADDEAVKEATARLLKERRGLMMMLADA